MVGCVVALASCTSGPNLRGGQYWQKTDITDQIYVRGVEGQKSLDRDISTCVMTLREAESIKPLKNAIPSDSPDANGMADWDTPTHDGFLRAEHSDSHDFSTCMKDKGWEHVDTVPYEVADEARASWYLANQRYGYDPRVGSAKKDSAEAGNFND